MAFSTALARVLAQLQLLAVDAGAEHAGALVRDRAIELVGGIGEQPDAVLDQLGR